MISCSFCGKIPDDCLECVDTVACQDRMTVGKTKYTCVCGTIKWQNWGFDAMADCLGCGRPDPRRKHAELVQHFDPNPRPLEPAQNGFLWCEGCEKPQPATGHECGVSWAELEAERDLTGALAAAESRAEFAESLLTAIAWDHGTALGWAAEDYCDKRAHLWKTYGCPYCDAAREGGR